MLGALAAFGAWQLLSLLWSSSASLPVTEFERTLLYLAAAATLILCLTAATVPALLGGIAAGVTIVSVYALGTRLAPGTIGGAYDPSSGYQLAKPIGYWNALGLLAGSGLVIVAGIVIRRDAFRASIAAVGGCPPWRLSLLHLQPRVSARAGRRARRPRCPDREPAACGRPARCAAGATAHRGRARVPLERADDGGRHPANRPTGRSPVGVGARRAGSARRRAAGGSGAHRATGSRLRPGVAGRRGGRRGGRPCRRACGCHARGGPRARSPTGHGQHSSPSLRPPPPGSTAGFCRRPATVVPPTGG